VQAFEGIIQDRERWVMAGNAEPPEMTSRILQLKRILHYENWLQHYETAVDNADAFVKHMKLRAAELSHDRVRFADEQDKKTQLEALEEEFRGAALHADFETLIETATRTALLAKQFNGLQDIDIKEATNEEILAAVSNQTLQAAVLPQLPPLVRSGVRAVNSSMEWVGGEGVLFKYDLDMVVNVLHLEHMMRMDGRDLTVAKLRNKFLQEYHHLRSRLSDLENCATSSALSTFSSAVCCGADEMCVICQEDLAGADDAIELHACGHRFHTGCIEGWVLGCKQECPVCKAPLGPSKRQDPPIATPPRFETGTAVRFQGLQARADLNGQAAEIMGWQSESGRYRVRLAEGCEIVAVRPDNLVGVEQSDPDASSDDQSSEEATDLAAALRMSMGMEDTEGTQHGSVEETLHTLQATALSLVRDHVGE